MKVNFVTILKARMEESIRFYTEVMGFEVARDFAAAPGRRIVFLADGPGTMIELIEDEGVTERASGDISIGFHVDDIEATERLMRENGVEITAGPYSVPSGVKLMSVLDPNGVTLGFVQEPPR